MENGKNFPPDTIPRIEEEKRETGPPPEAPVPVPLTEAQRRFAAQYHALIYGFLLEKKLEIREYYDTILRQSAIFTLSNAILPKRVCTDTASPRSRGAP